MGKRLLNLIKQSKSLQIVLTITATLFVAQLLQLIFSLCFFHFSFRFCLLISLLLISIVFVKYKRFSNYKSKTGRNYYDDRQQYRRRYRDLLRYFEQAEPYKLDTDSLPAEDWRDAEGIIFGHIDNRLVKRDSNGQGNCALFAKPGDGKTTSQIIPTALRFGGSVLAIDIKGDIAAVTSRHRHIKFFAPEEPDISCHINLFHGVKEMAVKDRKITLELAAMTLIPDEKDGKYFVEGARDFFCGISLLLFSKKSPSFPDVVKEVLHGNAIDWVVKIRDSDCLEAKEYTDAYYGSNERNVSGAYQHLVKCLRPFSNGDLNTLLDGQGDCISPQTLENGYDVYIKIPQSKIRVYAPLISCLVQSVFMMAFLSRKDLSSGQELRPILLLLDEFNELHFDYGTLMTALATLRSKKVSVFVAMQSVAQLKHRYGENGFRGIIDTCGYISLMSAQDPENRKYFQELVGKRKILRATVSHQNGQLSRSSLEDEEYIFQSSDFNNLGDRVLVYTDGRYALAEKCNIRNQEALGL